MSAPKQRTLPLITPHHLSVRVTTRALRRCESNIETASGKTL